jgi:hypothetical protein
MVASRAYASGVALSAAMFASGPAHAGNKMAAEALFRDGTQLLEAGHVDEACAKLAASQAIDPALGTLLYLAACHEKEGLTASAWSEFSSATQWAQRANQPERVQFARRHLAALETRLSGVLIHASKVAGFELRVDDGLLTAAAVGTRLPLDPGDHTIEASAPGYQTWRTRITIVSGQTVSTVTVPRLVEASAPSGPAAPIAASSPTESPEPAHDATIQEPATDSQGAGGPGGPVSPVSSNPHILTWTAVGIAGAGIVVGTTFGALTFGARDSARSECPNNRCSPGGFDDIRHARTDATVSTIGFGVGLAAAGAAGYLLIRGDGGARGAPTAALRPITIVPGVSAHEASVSILGRFQ